MDQLWHIKDFPWWHFLIRGSIVYIAVLVLLRLSGKRQVGQMGTGELVTLLLISNAVQNAMNGGDTTVTGGLILATVLISITYILAIFTYRWQTFEHVVQGKPTLLIHKGKIIRKHLRQELLPFREIRSALRRQGIHDLSEIEEAILESNGGISVIKRGEPKHLEDLPAADVV